MRVNFEMLNEEQKDMTDEQTSEEVKRLETLIQDMSKELRN